MKKLAVKQNIFLAILLFIVSGVTYALAFTGVLKIHPDVFLTQEQHLHLLLTACLPLFILSLLACAWFYFTYNKAITMKTWLKRAGDASLILFSLAALAGVFTMPAGDNRVFLLAEDGKGRVQMFEGYTYADTSKTTICENMKCGEFSLSPVEHYNMNNKESKSVISFGLGSEEFLQKIGKIESEQSTNPLQLFTDEKVLSNYLNSADSGIVCVECVTSRARCKILKQECQNCKCRRNRDSTGCLHNTQVS